VVDGLSRGYRVIVPLECVADRHESPHFANLYDMEMKYAAVLPAAEVAEYYMSYGDSAGRAPASGSERLS
jgi:hypothetical protein